MTFPPEVWSGVLRRLEEKLPAFTYEAWITPLMMGDVRSDRIIVLCPTPFHRDRVRVSLRDPITQAISDELGRCPVIDFDVADETGGARETGLAEFVELAGESQQTDSDQATTDAAVAAAPLAAVIAETTSQLEIQPQPGAAPGPSRSTVAPGAPRSTAGPGAPRSTAGPGAARPTPAPSAPHRRPRSVRSSQAATRPGHARAALRTGGPSQPELPFSFDNFVVGPCNALAREAAFAVAGGQQMALQQLYLASPTGLGKTHLARAVAAEVARTPGRTVRYANAETFTSEFVSALRNKRTPEFKRRYRPERGGLLVLEDVQFLAAKRATQLEFFHSVQHVLDAGGRVMLTGDRMPQEMSDLDERVREQLAGGFVAALEPPDALVRRQILKTKAAHGAIALPDTCLDLLVESVGGNVRELEGVLMQVVTTSTLLKRPIDLELTKRSIAQKVQPMVSRARRPEIADVVSVVATFFQTSPEMLAARSRKRAVLVPRQLAMYLCHRHTEAALAEIGRALGRDHPSVRNAIKKVEREMLESPKLRYQVEALTTRIQERSG